MQRRAQGLDLLFLLDAKSLLFIQHQQAEPLKAQARGEQGMGADDDIHLTRF